jgi:D-alanyl-D-alanine carboxypeptidase
MTNRFEDRQLDGYIETCMQRQRIPGLSLGVIRNGETVVAKGYGLANFELNVSATEDTVYEIGSLTKPFTASAIFLLIEEGKIRLDDSISEHIANTPPAWDNVRVRHLLAHTSGIRSYTEGTDLIHLFRNDYTQEEILRSVIGLPLDSLPGEQWAYSNTGYYLLGIIIEKVSGRSYWEFLAENIFEPLGMTSTRPSSPKTIVKNRAGGYSLIQSRLENRDAITSSSAWSAGSLLSTVLDIAKWDAALCTHKIFTRSCLQQMWTAEKLNSGLDTIYGFGWIIDDICGHRHIWHNGGNAGFHATFSRFIDEKLSVVVLTNLAGAGPESMARGIAGLFVPALRPPSMIEAHPDSDPAMTELFRRFLLNYASDNGEDLPFMTPTCFPASVRAWRLDYATWVRNIESFTFVTSDDVEEQTVFRYGTKISRYYHYRSANPQGTRYFTFAVTADNKIVDFYSAS